MNKTELLNKVAQTADERQLLARVWDKAEQAQRGVPAWTPFLSQSQQEAANRLIAAAGYPRHLWTGGFDDAERKLCAFFPDWQEEEAFESPLTALRCRWQSGEKLSHRDFLGSLMGMGIVREKVGDILVAPGSADLLVLEGVADFLLQSWNSAGRAKLRVSAIEPENLHIPTVQRKEVRDTVSSLRLDAVAASGFRLARGKAAALIESGKVQLNWRECVKPDKLLEAGDVVSARGFGKFELSEVGGLTRKGRISIVLQVYV